MTTFLGGDLTGLVTFCFLQKRNKVFAYSHDKKAYSFLPCWSAKSISKNTCFFFSKNFCVDILMDYNLLFYFQCNIFYSQKNIYLDLSWCRWEFSVFFLQINKPCFASHIFISVLSTFFVHAITLLLETIIIWFSSECVCIYLAE